MTVVALAHFLKTRKLVFTNSLSQQRAKRHPAGAVVAACQSGQAVWSYCAFACTVPREDPSTAVFISSASLQRLLFSNSPQHTEDNHVFPSITERVSIASKVPRNRMDARLDRKQLAIF